MNLSFIFTPELAGKRKRTTVLAVVLFRLPGGDLLCQDPAVQVPSTLESLTSVFGMGTGVTSPSLPPDYESKVSTFSTKKFQRFCCLSGVFTTSYAKGNF